MNSIKDALTEALQHPIVEEPHRSKSGGRGIERIEKRGAKIPAEALLWSSLGSIGVSLALRLMGKRDAAKFMVQCAPAFFVLGMYNKLRG